MHPTLLRHKNGGVFANAYITVAGEPNSIAQFFSSEGVVLRYAGGINAVRDIHEMAHLTRDARLFFVVDADRLDRQSYPALLKLIEEPPSGRHFILTSRSIESVPETIRSRSVVIFLDDAHNRNQPRANLDEFLQLGGLKRSAWIETCAEDELRFGAFLDAYEQWARTRPNAADLLRRVQNVRASEKTLNIGRKMCLEYLTPWLIHSHG